MVQCFMLKMPFLTIHVIYKGLYIAREPFKASLERMLFLCRKVQSKKTKLSENMNKKLIAFSFEMTR